MIAVDAETGRPPLPRIDGLEKVTGAARYCADLPVEGAAWAYLITSTIARGRLLGIDLVETMAVPGIVDVMTHDNSHGLVREPAFYNLGGNASTTLRPLETERIAFAGQIIGVVLAESFEAAREGAQRAMSRYDQEPASGGFGDPGLEMVLWQDVSAYHHDMAVGDAVVALPASATRVEARYTTPAQHHNPIELFSTTCVWDGPRLTIIEPNNYLYGMKNGVAEQLGIDTDDVEVVCRLVGGSFGAKGPVPPRTVLIALAARRLGRPVRIVVPRSQMFTAASFRAETEHEITLGAEPDGRVIALSHTVRELSSRVDPFALAGTEVTSRLYGIPNVATRVEVVKADRQTAGFMRSPLEVPCLFALESAVDEMAVELGIDPIELRRINDSPAEPIKGVPWSSRPLMQCFDVAAEAFGWRDRISAPGSMRDGDWLLGWGCASAIYPTWMGPATAHGTLTADGGARIDTVAHEIGTGVMTVMAEFTAERLGIAPERVTVNGGTTRSSPVPAAGGACTTASVCSAIAMACDAILAQIGDLPPESRHEAFGRLGVDEIAELAEFKPAWAPGDVPGLYKGKLNIASGLSGTDYVRAAFGAQFVEVRIHARTREIRVSRLVGAFASGRIMNERLARGQLVGGLIWGIGSALHEATEVDPIHARYVNDNLAEYLMPVNADIGMVEVIFVGDDDRSVNDLGIKGLGELGTVGINAAIANAVHHATGVRVRDLPIRIDQILGRIDEAVR